MLDSDFLEGGRFISCLLPTCHNTNKPASFEILVQLLWPQLLRSDRAAYALKLTEKKQSTNGSMLLNKSTLWRNLWSWVLLVQQAGLFKFKGPDYRAGMSVYSSKVTRVKGAASLSGPAFSATYMCFSLWSRRIFTRLKSYPQPPSYRSFWLFPALRWWCGAY